MPNITEYLENIENAILGEDVRDSIHDAIEVMNNVVDQKSAEIDAKVGTPFTAATAADMTDTEKIYVYTGEETGYETGHWYYYDSTEWVRGGAFNSPQYDYDDLYNKPPIVLVDDDEPEDDRTNIWFDTTETDEIEVPTMEEFEELKTNVSERTKNLLNVNEWSSANSSMSVSNGVVANAKTDSRTYIQMVILAYYGDSIVSTVYAAQETTRKKEIVFVPEAAVNGIRIGHSGASQDEYIKFTGFTLSAGTSYALSFDITGADPSTVGGFSIADIMLEQGASATSYIPYITASDKVARESIDVLEENEVFMFDEMYSARFLLSAQDYLTVTGKYIGTSGVVADSANHIASNYIRIHKGDVLTYTLRGSNNSVAVVYLYDNNKNPISYVALATAYNEDVTGTYTSEIDGYVRLSNRVDFDSPVFRINSSGQLLGIKNLISNSINESSEDLPEYWRASVASAIDRYKVKSELIGNHGVSFGFVSDTHWYYNVKNSAKILNVVCRSTDLDTVIHGGDFLRYDAEEIMDFTKDIDKSLTFLPVIGNHEYDSSEGITLDSVYAYAFKRSEKHYKHISGFNYCYDNPTQQVRFIILDYNDASCVSLLETWVSELESGWKVIVVCHMYWEPQARGTEPTVTTIGGLIASKIDSLNSTSSADIILYLCGHVHRDLNTVTSGGVPIVSINCDAYSDYQSYAWGGYKMYADDTTGQCIDLINIDTASDKIYMTRIGAGQDREITF